MIEFFTVRPDEDDAFLSAWSAAAPPGATLHQALRDDVQPRFAALDPGGPDTGVLLLIEFDGDPARFEPVFARWAPRQGFIESRLSDGTALVHWSSPLMYARAVKAEGDLLAGLPFSTRAALYKWSRKDR